MNHQIPEDLKELHKNAHEWASLDYETMVVKPETVYQLIERLAQAAADKQNTTQYIADLQADRDALQRENEWLKAPVSNEELRQHFFEANCGSFFLCDLKAVDELIASRAQATTKEKNDDVSIDARTKAE